MENQQVQHLEINIPEWLANSNDQIVIICSDNDGSVDTENQNENQQELVVPINAILDETEENQVVFQMPVESSEVSTVPIQQAAPEHEQNQVLVQMPFKSESSTPILPSMSKHNQAEIRLPVEMTRSTITQVVSQEEQAQVSTVKVVIKEVDSNADENVGAVPVALIKSSEEAAGVVVDGSGDGVNPNKPKGQSYISVEHSVESAKDQQGDVSSENVSENKEQGQDQSEHTVNLKEHDYLAEKQSTELKTATVSRRSKRKATMSPRRRWCNAGCCEDGKQHGKSQVSPIEARREKSSKHKKTVGNQESCDDEPHDDENAIDSGQTSVKKIASRSSHKRKKLDSESLPEDVAPAVNKETPDDGNGDGEAASMTEPEDTDLKKEPDAGDIAVDSSNSTKALGKKAAKTRVAKKREQDNFTITPDGINPDDPLPINVIKAAKPKDVDSIMDPNLAGVNTRFECVCGQKFTQKKSLIRHFRRKKARVDGVEESGSEHYSKYPIAIYPNTKAPRQKPPPKQFPCPYCPKVLQTKGGIDYHIMSHTGIKPVLCSLCGESFKSKQILDQHFVIHTQNGELPHKCDHCGRTYLTASRLRAHQKIHGEKMFRCEFCSHGFVMRKDLKKHMRVHTGEKPFECQFCDERFHFSQDVKRHLKRIHFDMAPFKCPICPKNNFFFKEDEYELHNKLHQEEADYHCEICLQNFTSYTTLRNHQMTHSDKNPFKCRTDSCNMVFKCANDRYLHERKFHDTNLLHCQFCRLSFKRQSAFEEHEKKHMQASYICRVDPECGMRFQQPHVRLRHEKSHNRGQTVRHTSGKGRKRSAKKVQPIAPPLSIDPTTIYQCGVCWKTYKNYPSLRDHVRDHGDEMPYECRVAGCGERFKRVYHRRKHEQSHSTDEIINSVLDSRLRANEESIDSSEEDVNGDEASPQDSAVEVDPNVNIEATDFDETEIAVQFVLH